MARDIAAMPVVAGEKTAGERFPGAERTYTVEGMMRDGRALQSGTSHYMGTNFATAFGIQYAAESGELEYCHTTSWGMSSRMLGGVIMTHGDDKGLVLPPRLAPYQVVIVPIGRGDQAGQVLPPARSWPAGCATRASARTSMTGPSFARLQVQRLGDARRPDPAGTRPPRSGRGLRADVDPARRGQDTGATRHGARPAARRAGRVPRPAAAPGYRVQGRPYPHGGLVGGVRRGGAAGWALAFHCGTPECEDDIKAATSATPRCIPAEGRPGQAGASGAICPPPTGNG